MTFSCIPSFFPAPPLLAPWIQWRCLRRLLRLRRLARPLLVALDHDHAQKAADDGRAEKDQNHGDADGPHAGREE